MARPPAEVYQLKVTLKYTTPPIWRRIRIPANATFEDLHHAIQDAMGWENCHLHGFEVINPRTGKRDLIGEPDGEVVTVPESRRRLSYYFGKGINRAVYIYDFGDGWIHDVKLEKILPMAKGERYPMCLAGKRACPPEDVGGVYGYMHALEVLSDPTSDEYEGMKKWFPPDFNPESFSPGEVVFLDPRERAKLGISDEPDNYMDDVQFDLKEEARGDGEEPYGWDEEEDDTAEEVYDDGLAPENQEEQLKTLREYFLSDDFRDLLKKAESGTMKGISGDQKDIVSALKENLDEVMGALKILRDPKRSDDDVKDALASILQILSVALIAQQLREGDPPEASALYEKLRKEGMLRRDILLVMSDIYAISLHEGEKASALERYRGRLSNYIKLAPPNIFKRLNKELAAL
jgi:hypothetical protein